MNAKAFNPRWLRLSLLVGGMACLVTGIWGGLLRVPVRGVPLPVEHANWLSFHGPLMVCGFLGTLISLERAVGLGRIWALAAPALAAAGSLSLVAGQLGPGPRLLLLAASVAYAGVAWRLWKLQPGVATVVTGLGAGAWGVGNGLWAADRPLPEAVLWWVSFLLLTIVGERIELTRLQRPQPWSRPWLGGALAGLGAGLLLGWVQPRAGGVLTGLAVIGLAGWLGRFDLAWRTVRHPGLPRFMAVCLLGGYLWLLVAGLLLGLHWPQTSGRAYDATLHVFFVGFVFAMIFGHAPVIFPAVLGLPVLFLPTAYVPLAVLHLSLLLRLGADLVDWPVGREWGAGGNALAVGLFLLNTLTSVGLSRWRSQSSRPARSTPT